MSILVKNGSVVLPGGVSVVDVYAEGETITAIGKNLKSPAAEVIDAAGKLVLPGGVDVHTHLEAPVGGTTSSDDFDSGTRAAAFGGTTAIIDFATQSKGEPLHAAYELWRKKAAKAAIDFGLHMIIVDVTGGQIEEIDTLIQEGVTSFKLFTAYPNVLMVDDETILRVLLRAGKQGALIAVHAENGSAINYLVRKALSESRTDPIEHALTRPAITEAEAVHRVIALARIAGVPVYIVHVSSAEALEEITRARCAGVPVYAETCPHYLLLTQQELRRPNLEGAKFVLTPPLRDRADQDALWQGLRDGDLQVVSTDHCPFMFATQKVSGVTNFTQRPNGGPGIENRLQLLHHHGVHEGKISVSRWVELVSTNPAKLFGLYPKKGVLQAGSDADIVIWDPDVRQTISASLHHMNVDYSMYEGMAVRGGAETVISRGMIIVNHGAWLGQSGRGKYLKRNPFTAV